MDINLFHYEDPLSEVTRKIRRNLLATASMSYLIVFMGLLPTKLLTLGIEFSEQNQFSFLVIILCLVLYFGITFSIYAVEDFIKWNMKIKKENETKSTSQSKALVKNAMGRILRPINEITQEEKDRRIENEIKKEVKLRLDQSAQKYQIFGYFRVFWDMFLPAIVGMGAIFVLIQKLFL